MFLLHGTVLSPFSTPAKLLPYLLKSLYDCLIQGSATFNVKRAILAPFLPNKIHVEPQNIWCPNIDNTAYN